jgi:hypothetical protein
MTLNDTVEPGNRVPCYKLCRCRCHNGRRSARTRRRSRQRTFIRSVLSRRPLKALLALVVIAAAVGAANVHATVRGSPGALAGQGRPALALTWAVGCECDSSGIAARAASR